MDDILVEIVLWGAVAALVICMLKLAWSSWRYR